ncbi:hypothetical protein L195_g060421, partial [Trifolium pratense]
MSSHQVISKKFCPIWGNYFETSINQEACSLGRLFNVGKVTQDHIMASCIKTQ